MDLSLAGKQIIVMGGSRGLGWAVAQVLREEGATVLLASRTAPTPGEGAWLWSELDTGDRSSIERFIDTLPWDRVDGLFVNTGGPRPGKFDDLADNDWQAAFTSLLWGPVLLIKGLTPMMAPGSSILFNTSSSIKVPIDSLLLSNVMRPAVAALAKSLSIEMANRQIRVNVIAPGRIATERVKELDQYRALQDQKPVDAIEAQAASRIPAGRYGAPREFGKAAAFLLSAASSYVTGASLFVDGGQTRAL